MSIAGTFQLLQKKRKASLRRSLCLPWEGGKHQVMLEGLRVQEKQEESIDITSRT